MKKNIMEKITHINLKDDKFSIQCHSISPNYSTKNSLISSCFCLPITSLLALFIILLTYNSFNIFFYFIPSFPLDNPKQTYGKSPSNSQIFSSKLMYAMKENEFSLNSTHFTQENTPKTRNPKRALKTSTSSSSSSQPPSRLFSTKVNQFFEENSCETRVFMTWISSLESFGDREMFCIESLFKFNPNACLLIVSNSMDTQKGTQMLRPFHMMKFKVMAIAPDFRVIFKNTMGDKWYNELKKGNVKKGDISLGQNLSNLARLALLYKYGGIYMDTDFIVLKKLNTLKNVIGAQMVDKRTRKWTRLNNALLIFDKKHPILSKFIEEFALTFNGNKWGYNGPYLVSRVIERLNVTMELDEENKITILPPTAFYVVDWVRVKGFFHKPQDEHHLKWIRDKIKQIEDKSYGVHLWNRESRGIKVENGSVISHLIKSSCVFCNS